MGRYALLVGISQYIKDQLDPLPRAVLDVEALRQVLINPEIGGFGESEVTVLINAEKGAIEDAIYNLFANRKPQDLVLLYFSGHGVIDKRDDKFYLTGISTRTNALPPSAIASKYVHDEMEGSRSQHQVIILDCCNSGAFPDGMKSKGVVMVDPKLGGEGKVILTASDSSQYAFEQEGFELSLYTHFLVEGLKTGVADKDEDGHVSVNEIHSYVEEKVKSVNDRMTPKFYGFMKEGQPIYLAKAVQDNSLKFRKEVEKVADRNNKGVLLPTARNRLNRESQRLGLTSPEAAEIIQEVLRPYVEYAEKLEEYAQTLEEMIALRFPFDEVMAAEVEDYESYLGLRPTDQATIKERILAPKQLEYEQAAQRQAEAQQIRQQQEATERQAAELLQRQQAELLRQQKLEAERKLEAEKRQAKLAQEKRLAAEKQRAESVQELTLDLGQGISLELVQIPAGKFMMGSNESDREKPIHEVAVQSFLMGKYAVTNAQWKVVMKTEPSKQYDAKFQGDNQPVVGVSWHDCHKFCKELSAQTGKEFRLPSEAEWEYACRARTQTKYHFGDDEKQLGSYAWYGNPFGGQTHPVGEKKPNQFGLYDMHGNVWEWCLDEWNDSYNSKPESLKANGNEPWGEIRVDDNDNRSRLLRGGSWNYFARFCRSAYRSLSEARVQYYYYYGFGFRVVCRLQ